MTQARWQLALHAHREAHPERLVPDHTRLMFVVCSESTAAASVLAAFSTAYALQTLTGVSHDLDIAASATLEYGILARGVRHIVICGHDSCRGDGDARTPEASQAVLVARCRALVDDAHMGRILRSAYVTVRALWFEQASHEIYACDFEGRPARCMDDVDLVAMFASFDELSA